MQTETLEPADSDSRANTDTGKLTDGDLVKLFDEKVSEIASFRNVSERAAKTLISKRMNKKFEANADNLKFKVGAKQKLQDRTRSKLQAALSAAADECVNALSEPATGILCACFCIFFFVISYLFV